MTTEAVYDPRIQNVSRVLIPSSRITSWLHYAFTVSLPRSPAKCCERLRAMKPRSSCSVNHGAPAVAVILAVVWCCLSSVARSQSSDSCSGSLAGVGKLIPFDTSNLTCLDAWSSENFVVRYASSGGTWSFVLSAPDKGGYVAVGFSPDGAMVGSSAVAGWSSGNGVGGVVKQYKLGGTSSGSCPPDQGSLTLVAKNTLVVAQSSRIYVAFQFTAPQPTPYLIYAVGPSNTKPSSGNYLAQHRTYTSAAVNYVAGTTSSAGGGFDTKKWHGAMAGLGWGVLMPVGIALARYFKKHDPFWFYAHISVQGVGFVLGVAGIVAGFKLSDDAPGADTHKALGITILVFGCLQVLAFLARPDKSSKVRRYWNWYHHYVGRAAVACAAVNIFIGLHIAHEGNATRVAYGIFLAVLALIAVFLEVKLWRRSR
ncbi:cytochrome b561 and DOMON domain-containing protein At3g07570-like [Oryza brachyantha]|nr:cytochrome b561 and DOMON domain-containing protein At3g07570-like [Oryza brachyantha]